MALPKLYEPITWVNDSAPALNEDNLNAISQGLSDVDDRVISLAGTIMEDVPQIQEDMEIIEAGLETVGQAVTDAQTAATSAAADKLVSEGWAKGTQNGSAVGSSSPYYHNNAEYFKDQARSFTPTGYQELVDDVDDLKEALTDEAETRSVLGAKNILCIKLSDVKHSNTTGTWSGDTYTISGVTVEFTAVNDYVTQIKLNGTATATITNLFLNNHVDLEAGSYICNGNPSGVTGNQYGLRISNVNYTINKFFEQGATLSLNSNTTDLIVDIRIPSGQVIDNAVFKPMLRLATDSDPTYQPYAMTNKELTDNKIDASQIAPIENGTTASTSYAQGAYFIHNGKFCKAKTSISSGATFTKGTNYEETTVAAELIALAQ